MFSKAGRKGRLTCVNIIMQPAQSVNREQEKNVTFYDRCHDANTSVHSGMGGGEVGRWWSYT